MIFRSFSILVVVAFGFCLAEKLTLPGFIVCNRNATNYGSCLRNSFQDLLPRLAKGLPPEYGLPRLEPFFQESEEFIFDMEYIYGKIDMSNITVHGLSKIRYLAVRPNHIGEFFRLEIDAIAPKLTVSAGCEAYGSFIGLQMSGAGKFNITANGLKGTVVMSGPVKDDVWIIEHVRIFPTLRKMKVTFKDLFNGNREMNELAAMFVNEHWPQLMRMLMPMSVEYWDKFLSNIFNRMSKNISFSKTLP